jgi:hypothetical protein
VVEAVKKRERVLEAGSGVAPTEACLGAIGKRLRSTDAGASPESQRPPNELVDEDLVGIH